jgi:alpha-beta hydrolase superfamily lysophospholipase
MRPISRYRPASPLAPVRATSQAAQAAKSAQAGTPALQTGTVGDARAFSAEDGVKVAFRVSPARTNSPDAVIVHVPGLGCNSHYMDELGKQLGAQNLKTYAIDNRGHGLTAGPKGDVQDYQQWIGDLDRLVAIAKQENPGKPVFVTGSSMGGLIALRYAQSHPKAINGVVSLSPVFMNTYFKPHDYLTLGKAIVSSLWDQHALDQKMDTPMNRDIPLTTNPEAVKMGEADPMLLKQVSARLYLNVMKMTMRNLAGAPLQTLPTMVATAGADQVNANWAVRAFQKVQGGFGLADHGKTFKNYPGAGHDLPEDWQRPEIAQDIAGFVKAHLKDGPKAR